MKILKRTLIIGLMLFLFLALIKHKSQTEVQNMPADNSASESSPVGDNEESSIVSGTFEYSLDVGGVKRTGLIHIPDGYMQGGPAVIVLHGGELGSGEKVQKQTNFNTYADKNNFIVIYPNSLYDQWNDGRPETNTDADDLGFIAMLINDLITRYGVDAERVFITGVSNGGNMTQWLVCNNIYDFAGIAPVVSNFPTKAIDACKPEKTLPIVFFHGTEDATYLGSEGRVEDSILSRGGAGGEILSAEETIELWRGFNDCGVSGPVTKIDNYPDDGIEVEKYEFRDCAPGSTLLRYKVIGGGHAWFGMDLGPIAKKLVGDPGKEIIAVEEIVKFFQRYGL